MKLFSVPASTTVVLDTNFNKLFMAIQKVHSDHSIVCSGISLLLNSFNNLYIVDLNSQFLLLLWPHHYVISKA